MSHFVLTLCLPGATPYDKLEDVIAERLAPYDENKEVDPHRNYESGEAADYWWYTSIQKDAKAVSENDRSRLKPYKPNEIGWSSAWSDKTEAEQWAEVEREAAVYNSLPHPVTWEALTAAYTRYYCDGFPHTGGTPLYYESETGRAYEVSTYNPEAKWDWYSVGGRWSDYFPHKEGDHSRLIGGDRSWTLENVPKKRGYCDGGPKKDLDLEFMRMEKAQEAGELYDKYHDLVDHLPEAKPWSYFTPQFIDLPNGDEKWAIRERVREEYAAQPRVKAADTHEDFKWAWDGDLIEKYAQSREDIMNRAATDAVPGYALLTLDRHWVAPGEMGWFGMSSESDEDLQQFKSKANEYIDTLPEDAILVAVDLHI